MNYSAKALLLEPWMATIMGVVKKEVRQSHLNRDHGFCQRYFPGQQPQRLTPEELASGYCKAIIAEEKRDDIAEFLFQNWLLKHPEIYNFFEKELSAITPDFTSLTELSDELALPIKERGSGEFGAEAVYLFSLMNGVVFSDSLMETLREEALAEQKQKRVESEQNKEDKSREREVSHYQEQIARLTDRYEKKLASWERKYSHDIEALKKQLASLQRQLHGKAS